jgi:membrane associated rhomboid family serine protease
MVEVATAVRSSSPPLRLDVCGGCQFVWFDPREFDLLPAAKANAPRPLPEKARELIALRQVQQVAEAAETSGDDSGPDEAWHWIPAILGLPVEENAPALSCWPWLTYGLAAVLVAVFALTVGNLNAVIEDLGLVPAQLWRHHGMTFVTSFFLHGGLLHLVGNVYFLLIFGDNVEDDLGRWRYAGLLAISALVGSLFHILGNRHSLLPCVGASGGISGVVTYYALRFPRVRLGFLFRYWLYFRWIHLPACAYLLLWFLMQLLFVVEEQAGVSNIAALAHLGGAAVGVAAWILWRARYPQEA